MVTNYLTKVAQTFYECFGQFSNKYLFYKSCAATFMPTFGNNLIWLLFIPTSGHTGCLLPQHKSVRLIQSPFVQKGRQILLERNRVQHLHLFLTNSPTIFKNGPSPASFSFFSSFQTNITIFTTNKCEKCPSSIRGWDSKTRPLEHESPPITTRPGPRPKIQQLWLTYSKKLKPAA